MTSRTMRVEDAAAMTVTPAAGLIDEPLNVSVRGLPPETDITLHARLLDVRGVPWSSHACFITDEGGSVNLAEDAPVSGSYSGVDPEGLITSLSDGRAMASRPFDSTSIAPIEVEFAAEIGGCRVVRSSARRFYVADNVESTIVRDNGISGLFFHPKTGDRRPGVIVLGGSSGGLLFSSQVAALLASHGFASLALAYFSWHQAPEHLIEIPLEYFEGAIRWFSLQQSVRTDAIGMIGLSRGAELALILGSRFPSIRSIAAYCPSSAVWNGLRGNTIVNASAWTESGRAIPFVSLTAPSISTALDRAFSTVPIALTPLFQAALDRSHPTDPFIPVEKINGPILLVSGEDDQMWPASRMGEQIMKRLSEHRHPFPSRHYRYPRAGHLMRPPGIPTTVLHGQFAFGGDGPAQAKANRAA